MNDFKLEKLLYSIKERGIKKKKSFLRSIALALFNQLTEEERNVIFKQLHELKKDENQLMTIFQ